MVAMRWTIRAIGLANTMILARVLTPEDFGLVAMATVVLGLLDAVTTLNVEYPLIRDRDVKRSYYDSAWTLQLLSGWFKCGAYLTIAPFLVKYYGDPRIGDVVCIIALRPAIEGFENIGQVDFRRDLRFDREFRYWVYRRILTFLLTIGVTLWLRNYLALAIAAPVSAAVTVLLSYLMSSYRPSLATRYFGELWRFSQWWLVLAFMRYFGNRGEAFILGGLTSPQVIGAYTLSGDLTAHLTHDVIGPIGRSLMPNYAKLAQEPKNLQRAFQVSFAVLASFSLAAGVGASLSAENIVRVLLGGSWIEATPFVRLLAIHAAFWSIIESMQAYFIVTHREKLFSLCLASYVAVLIPAIFIAAHLADVEMVAAARTVTTILFSIGMLGMLVAIGAFNLPTLVSFLWRPFIAAGVMGFCVWFIDVSAPPFVELGLQLIMGLVVFPTSLVLLWTISGRPDGIESTISGLFFEYARSFGKRCRKSG